MRLCNLSDVSRLMEIYDEAIAFANDVAYIDWPNPFPEELLSEFINKKELYGFSSKDDRLLAAQRVTRDGNKRVWSDATNEHNVLYLGKAASSDEIRGQNYFLKTMLP